MIGTNIIYDHISDIRMRGGLLKTKDIRKVLPHEKRKKIKYTIEQVSKRVHAPVPHWAFPVSSGPVQKSNSIVPGTI
jgi:hypothetical protein